MKTLFALLGLFMFASVSSTDLTTSATSKNDQPMLTESGDGGANTGTVAGSRKVLVIL
ncbi:hypothetical protein M0M57_05420 [Flavobacterium azooxidireducens]|uniref:Uncharacterized protein n=1 Tax=Flavobacterium azooxidireducens TaxID=1871076 RepID=A0ABY4KLI8_9FLAO|nr:hypothetical protein [Flavobacterium azooxidireducens]UPQ80275.1 hypothetical protein M0M57_05420 [Flavobacterium azooxidireducens]